MEIKVLPNRVITASRDETLMDALVRQGLSVQNVCNGQGTCGKCRVRIIGTVPSPTERDRKHLNETELSAGIRLACAVAPEQGMTIELDVVDNLDRKEAALLGMKVTTLDPGVEMAGLSVSDLDSVILSGTFATYLKAENILNIGLVPNIAPERIKAVGNAAHMGAIRALLDQHQLAFAEDLYRKIRHIELGGSATFSDYFMESMYLERLEEECKGECNDGN